MFNLVVLRTPLHHFAHHGVLSCCNMMLEAAANVDSRDVHGQTPLHYSVWHGHVEVVELLLDAGADAEARDDSGRSVLSMAWDASSKGLLRRAGATSPSMSPSMPQRITDTEKTSSDVA